MKKSRTRKRSVEERGSRLNVNEEALYLGIRKHMRFSVIDRVSASREQQRKRIKERVSKSCECKGK
jgi:hypothetical protein